VRSEVAAAVTSQAAGADRQPALRRKFIFLALAFVLLALCFRAIIRGDGIGYYAYLPSLVGQRSIDLQPTFDSFIDAGVPSDPAFLQLRLRNGLTADYKQVGSALLALPFYAATTVVLGVTRQTEDPALNPVYQFAFTAASLAYALLALFLLYRFVKELWGAWSGRLAVAGAVFGTPLVAYLLFEPSYSHAFTVAAIIAFALFLYQSGPDRTVRQWLVLGLLGGVMVITHVQEILFMALIPAEAGWLLARHRWSVRLLPGYALATIGFVVGVVPQLLFDRLLFERWLPPSAPNISFDFLHPHLVELLTSTHHGWLSWSPLVVVAFLGFPLLVRRLGWFAVALIAIGIGEVWLNASLSDWWGGLGFGSRRLTDQTLLLALSYGALFNALRARRRLVIGAVAAGIGWTVVLLAQFYYIIVNDVGPRWHDFLLGQLQALPYVPRLFVQGTVIRDLASGRIISGLASAIALTALLLAVSMVSRRLWATFRRWRPPVPVTPAYAPQPAPR
jgi:hypothetical protein